MKKGGTGRPPRAAGGGKRPAAGGGARDDERKPSRGRAPAAGRPSRPAGAERRVERGAPAGEGRRAPPRRTRAGDDGDARPMERSPESWSPVVEAPPEMRAARPRPAARPQRRDERGGPSAPRRGPSESGAAKASKAGKPAARSDVRPGTRPAAAAPDGKPTKAQQKAAATQALVSGVQMLEVAPDEDQMRVDRFMEARFPALSFSHIQRIVRKGELRVDGGRVKPNDRVSAGAKVRVPPLVIDEAPRPTRLPARDASDAAFLKSVTLYEDADVLVINKPAGLSVQGGSGTTRHVDGMLDALTGADGQKPRLVHRLDKDTAGCLVIAKTRYAAMALSKSFRSRATRKIYWALVKGVPRVPQGRVSTYLARDEDMTADARMKVAEHGDEGASHALTYYALVDHAGHRLAWLSMKPVTGRTHQLRAHAAHIGHPIIGDPKYFNIENWELPGGIQNKLHLLARRIVIPHPRTGAPIDVTAPLPPHMQQSFNLLGFETAHYDPIIEAPEE